MSTATLPRSSGEAAPEPASAPADDEGWALLENLRRRLEEQAAQGRRTQQQVTQLAESIGALVEAQRRRSRWLNLNSFVAYLIFTMLCGAGFYALYVSRAGTLVEARDAAQRERDQAVRRADEAAAKAAAREQADGSAWEVYQLLEAGKRTEATGKLAALRDLPLSRTERAVLAAKAHETQVMAVDAALKAALASFKAGRFTEVIAPLEAALVSEPAGARAILMRYYLGIAYARAGKLELAIGHLQAAVDADTDQDDARFQLASALDRSGAWGRARVEYDRFATAHPQSPFAVYAMRRSATLARMPATDPALGAAAPPQMPAGQGAVAPPGGGGVPPAGVGVPPAGVGVPPAGVGVPPAGVGVPPAGGGVPPAGGGVPPAGGGVPPAGGGVPPAGNPATPGGAPVLKPPAPATGALAPQPLAPPAAAGAPALKPSAPPAGAAQPQPPSPATGAGTGTRPSPAPAAPSPAPPSAPSPAPTP